jgi:hypothetical protein
MVSDVGLVDKGIELRIAPSKTDQAREVVIVAIPEGNRIRPKALLLAWMATAGHADGYLFRRLTRGNELTDDAMSDRAIARLAQRYAALAGYESVQVLSEYVRSAELFEDHAGAGFL